MNMFFGFILTMGFVTSLPVSKKINVDYYDIEALQRNEAYGRNTTGWRILFFLFTFLCLLPAVGFPLLCHNLRVVCSMNYK